MLPDGEGADAERARALYESVTQKHRPGWVPTGRNAQHDPLDATFGVLRPLWERFDNLLVGIRNMEPSALESGLNYLEAAPRFLRSGYIAEAIMRGLSRAPLTSRQSDRLRAVVVAETQHRQTRGWRDIGKLAGTVWNEQLAQQLGTAANTGGREGHRAARIAAAATAWRQSTGLAFSDRR